MSKTGKILKAQQERKRERDRARETENKNFAIIFIELWYEVLRTCPERY